MSTRRMLRSVAVTTVAASLVLSTIALPAAAKGPKLGRGPAIALAKQSAMHGKYAAKAHGKAGAKGTSTLKGKSGSKGKSAQAKQRKAARFVATGIVVAVDVDTLTVAVTGGSKSLRRTETVITVAPDARINRDDVAATVADIVAGDHVAVAGTRRDGGLVAARVNASSPEPVVDEPTENVIDEPTENVTETVIEDPTDDVTETVTEGPTEDPTETVTDEPTETTVF